MSGVNIVCSFVLHLRTSSTHIRTLLEITYTNTTLNTQIIIHEFKDCMRICTAHTCTMVYIKHNAYFRSIYEHNVRSTHIRTPLSTHKLPSKNVKIVCGSVLHLRTSSTHIRTLLEITYTNTTLNTQIIIREFKDCMRICNAFTCTNYQIYIHRGHVNVFSRSR